MNKRIFTFRLTVISLTLSVFLIACSTSFAKVTKEVNPNNDPSGLVHISPTKLELTTQLGQSYTFEMSIYNESAEATDVSIVSSDIAPGSDPKVLVEDVEDGEFGAGDWVFPEINHFRMKPFERYTFPVRIVTPQSAPVGTNFAGILVETTKAEGEPGTQDYEGNIRPRFLMQVYLTVPGDIKHDLKITSFKNRKAFVLGGTRFVSWDVTLKNDGNVNEHVSGDLRVTSIFGNTAFKHKFKEFMVLRGATRTQRIVWHDLPFVGSFQAVAELRGDNAQKLEESSSRIWIAPWWLLVLVVGAVVFPLVLRWWRNRQDWKQYLDDDYLDEVL